MNSKLKAPSEITCIYITSTFCALPLFAVSPCEEVAVSDSFVSFTCLCLVVGVQYY